MPKKPNTASKKTNITLKLDTALLRAVKVVAAKRRTSVSALLAEELAELTTKDEEYEKAMKHSISLMNEGWKLGWKKPKSRDELHER